MFYTFSKKQAKWMILEMPLDKYVYSGFRIEIKSPI